MHRNKKREEWYTENMIKYENLFNWKVNDQVEISRVFKENAEERKKHRRKNIEQKVIEESNYLDELPEMGPSDWLIISLRYLLCTELEIHYYYYYPWN